MQTQGFLMSLPSQPKIRVVAEWLSLGLEGSSNHNRAHYATLDQCQLQSRQVWFLEVGLAADLNAVYRGHSRRQWKVFATCHSNMNDRNGKTQTADAQNHLINRCCPESDLVSPCFIGAIVLNTTSLDRTRCITRTDVAYCLLSAIV